MQWKGDLDVKSQIQWICLGECLSFHLNMKSQKDSNHGPLNIISGILPTELSRARQAARKQGTAP